MAHSGPKLILVMVSWRDWVSVYLHMAGFGLIPGNTNGSRAHLEEISSIEPGEKTGSGGCGPKIKQLSSSD